MTEEINIPKPNHNKDDMVYSIEKDESLDTIVFNKQKVLGRIYQEETGWTYALGTMEQTIDTGQNPFNKTDDDLVSENDLLNMIGLKPNNETIKTEN